MTRASPGSPPLAAIMAPYRNGTPSQTTQDWKRLFPAEGFGPLRERHVTHNHAGHPEQVIVEHILSVSYNRRAAGGRTIARRRARTGRHFSDA